MNASKSTEKDVFDFRDLRKEIRQIDESQNGNNENIQLMEDSEDYYGLGVYKNNQPVANSLSSKKSNVQKLTRNN